jgi:hypothetical protein
VVQAKSRAPERECTGFPFRESTTWQTSESMPALLGAVAADFYDRKVGANGRSHRSYPISKATFQSGIVLGEWLSE